MTATKKIDDTLLQRIGGVDALVAVIEAFYGRLLEDDSLQVFFENVDMAWLKKHQKNFLMSALSGPVNVEAVIAKIRRAHTRLFAKGLSEKHFDTVAGHLVATMQSVGVEQQLIDEVVGVVGALRPAFVPPETKSQDMEQPVEKETSRGLFGCLSALVGR